MNRKSKLIVTTVVIYDRINIALYLPWDESEVTKDNGRIKEALIRNTWFF
jgi:hypothetical protein